jgi:surface antigen
VRACALAVVALGVLAGGCSYQLGSLLDREGDKTPAASAVGPVVAGSGELPSDTDLAYASAAAVEVLAKGGKDISAPWENPDTGARGTVTPIATAYAESGAQCREFLASYVAKNNEAWLQGEACRAHQGRWVVRSLKPWQRARDPGGTPATAVAATDS